MTPVHYAGKVVSLALAATLMAVLAGCSRPSAAPDLRILWTNDTHGYLSPLYHREEGDDRFVERARREGRVGGFAYIAAIANRQRGELPERTLLLDSGDTWHGTVLPVRLAGAPVVQVMNAMGYDAMVPGNVDFFYDEETIRNLFAEAGFPIVVANLYDGEWGERAELPNTQPYIIRQVNGLKVAIIGMTYHWMAKVARHPQWSFGLRVTEVQADIDQLRAKENVDLVVLLSHMGWKADARYAELVSGIDVIVGAHTHDILYRPTIVHNDKSKRDVLIVQCGSHGKMVGQLDLQVAGGRITAFEQTLFPTRNRKLTPDPEISELIDKLRAPYKAELERVIGETRTVMYRQGTWQSTADNLVADALRSRTMQDIAVSEPGRYGATILPGPITVEDVFNLVPTEIPIYYMKFTGRTLRAMLEGAIDNVISDDPLQQIGGNMWRFSGIEIAVDLSRPYPERIVKMRVNGSPVSDEQLYSLAEFNLFLRNNPDAINVTETNRIGPHEVISYIEKRGEVAPQLDQRITDHHGRILSDHAHLHDVWAETGRDEFDLENTSMIQYQGALDSTGRFKVGPVPQ